MSNLPIKRRNVYINKSFQGRFIAWMFMLILLSGLCSAFLIYWLTGGELQAQAQTTHFNILNVFEQLGLSILIGNMVAMLVAGTITVFVVIIASHKIAGPLHRFEKICEQIGDDQLDTITTLREKDQLQDLGQAFTTMATKLRNRKDQRLQCITKLNLVIDQLNADKNIPPEKFTSLEQLLQTLRENA